MRVARLAPRRRRAGSTGADLLSGHATAGRSADSRAAPPGLACRSPPALGNRPLGPAANDDSLLLDDHLFASQAHHLVAPHARRNVEQQQRVVALAHEVAGSVANKSSATICGSMNELITSTSRVVGTFLQQNRSEGTNDHRTD